MTDETGRGPLPSSRRVSPRRRWLPFWILQAVEVAVAIVFVDVSVHVSNGGMLIAGALVYAGLAVTARGPLGILRICGRKLHVWLAIGASVVLALTPVFATLRPDIEGIVVIEFGAIGLVRLATFTQTVSPPSGAGRPSGPVIDARATVGHTPVPSPRAMDASEQVASSGGAARWMGRTAAAAAASGKRVADEHRPEAEAHVKRSIRGVGRLVGRLSSSAKGSEAPQP